MSSSEWSVARGSVTPRPRRSWSARRRLVGLILLFAAAWTGFVIAGSLARANDLETRLTDDRARTLALKARVEAGQAEIAFVQTEVFLGQASRGLGCGTDGEQSFALPDHAPPPPPIPIVGSTSIGGGSASLDGLLDTIFGPGGRD